MVDSEDNNSDGEKDPAYDKYSSFEYQDKTPDHIVEMHKHHRSVGLLFAPAKSVHFYLVRLDK
jgi:hypothetical protein